MEAGSQWLMMHGLPDGRKHRERERGERRGYKKGNLLVLKHNHPDLYVFMLKFNSIQTRGSWLSLRSHDNFSRKGKKKEAVLHMTAQDIS